MARMSDEEFAREIVKDPLFFMESCLKIVPKAGGLVKFKLNDEQYRVFLEYFWKAWSSGEPVRLIVLKARQLGISTLIEALIYWYSSLHQNTNSLIISNDLESAAHILSMSQTFYDNDGRFDRGLLPMRNRNNARAIEFANPNRFDRNEDPGLGSKIVIGTADTRSSGRSKTLQALHLSEVAFWTNANVIASALNALARQPKTMGFIESTANGSNGYFYETWKAAEKGQNDWTPVFLSWKGRSEYRMHMSPKQTEMFANQLTPDEVKLMEKHGLHFEEMAWRRKKISEYIGTGREPNEVFREEYPLEPEDAFITTGRQYFSMRSVDKYDAAAKEAKFEEGYIELVAPFVKNKPSKVVWHPRERLSPRPCQVRQWKRPEVGADYVIGADVAMGFSSGDYSVAYAMRRDTQEFVARIRGQIEPDAFADLLVEFAWYYNEAFLCPENNSIGMAVAQRTSGKYRRHAYQIDLSTPYDLKYNFDKPGWHTGTQNRREMFGYMRQCIRDMTVHIWDEDFFAEAKNFVVPEEKDGRMREDKPRASEHKHDDCIAAAAITLAANDVRLAGNLRRTVVVDDTELGWRVAEQKRVEDSLMSTAKAEDEHMGAYI